MKKFRTIAIIAASAFLILFAGSTANAQSVSLNTATGKKALNEKTLACTFQVDGLSSKSQVDQMATKLAVQGVHKAEVKNYAAGKADLVLTLPKGNAARTIQAVLLAAGVNKIKVDGVEIATSTFAETIQKKIKK